MDPSGRLRVLGGNGESGTVMGNFITQYANNDFWYDDISDGPVTARVVLNGTSLPPKGERANNIYMVFTTHYKDDEGQSWVLVAPPKFAPDTPPLVSLYTTIQETQQLTVRKEVSYHLLCNGKLMDG